jgi:hypothetical protein
MKTIQDMIKRTERRISASLSDTFKIGRGLSNLGMLRLPPKKAFYSEKDINAIVESELRKEGVQGLGIDWAGAFKWPILKVKSQRRWDQEKYEEIFAAVFEDILMGENLNTGGVWSSGKLASQVKRWIEEGKTELDIVKLLRAKVGREAVKKEVVLSEGRKDTQITKYDHVSPNNASEEKGLVFLDVLSMNPLSKAKASEWMSLVDNDPEIRVLLRKVDDIINQISDDSVKLLWEVLKDTPDFRSKRELAEETVSVRDAQGILREMPLWEALGKRKPNDIWYEFEKLEKDLADLKPHIYQSLTN